jgi:hypothetical protein
MIGQWLRDVFRIGSPGERVMMITRLKREALTGKPRRGAYTYTKMSRQRYCRELQAAADASRLAKVYHYDIKVESVLEYGFQITLKRQGDEPIRFKAYYWQDGGLKALFNHPYLLSDGDTEIARVKHRIEQINDSLKEKAKWKKKKAAS